MSHDELGLTIAIFFIGLILSILAAIMAYIIAYQEYIHHYLDKKDASHEAMRSAYFTFGIFMALTIFLAIFLRKIIS